MSKNHFAAVKNNFLVFISRKTYVGYNKEDGKIKDLPVIKDSVFSASENIKDLKLDIQTIHRLNVMYANDWVVKKDADILLRNIF